MKVKIIGLCCLLFGGSICSGYAQQASEDKQIEILLSKMSLKEKIGQMNQLNFNGQVDESLVRKIRNGEVGSLLNVFDPIIVNELQRVAAKESKQGIPLIIGRDVIHGLKTILPIPLGQAASFDPDVVESGAKVAAAESKELGINWTFAPMLDISRDARWGRIAESLGEDPFLTGELGAAMVRGFQGDTPSSPTSIAACVKHFIGYGASEGGRDYNSTNIPIHLMHNVYLVPFKKTIKAGALSLMTSFNDNDGIPASGNKYLLKDVLRNNLKFDGFVVSDWASINEMVSHGFAKDGKDAARIATNAGIDMEMVSEQYITHLEDLVKEGKVSEKDIDNAVRNILRVKLRLGLFNNPYTTIPKQSVLYAESHLQVAKDAAVKSAILLKNNNVLPLRENLKVTIVGPMADAPHDQMGTWVFDGEKEYTVTPIGALKSSEFSNINYSYEPGLMYSRDKDESRFSKVRKAVESADIAVVFLGEEAILSGEAHSLSNIDLQGAQSNLLKTVKSVGKPVVLVIMAGRPLTIAKDLPYADAVLYNFHPGTMGGPAILDLLFGRANPSGKLPVTFVKEVGQIPMYYNHNNTGRPVVGTELDITQIPLEAGQTSLGNTSFYLDSGIEPLFPFGYGLSYTKFEYTDLQLSSTAIPLGGTLSASVTVRNVGDRDGYETVQLYTRDLVGSITRPVKELKGFKKVLLKSGESRVVKFEVSTDDLAFLNAEMRFEAEPGDFNLWIGGDSNAKLMAKFAISE